MTTPSSRIAALPVDQLLIGDDFRLDDDPEALAELAASVAEHGILQPLLVRQTGGGWEVVAGRRRLAAARTAGLEAVPCVVRDLTDDEALDAALAENMHRRRLSPIEQALAFARLREKGLTQVAIARRVGRSDFTVSVFLQLLDMPEDVRKKVHAGKMTYSTAYDRWKRRKDRRTGKRQGGSRPSALKGDEATIVSHWRRRHDRLIAGLHVLRRSKAESVPEFKTMVDRLLKVDLEPLDAPADAPLAQSA